MYRRKLQCRHPGILLFRHTLLKHWNKAKNREHGENVITVPYDCYEIENAIRKQLDHKKYKPKFIYGDENAGRMIVDILFHNEVNLRK